MSYQLLLNSVNMLSIQQTHKFTISSNRTSFFELCKVWMGPLEETLQVTTGFDRSVVLSVTQSTASNH